MVQGDWNDGFLRQLGSFPIGKKDDKIDSVSGARMKLAPIFTWKKIGFLKI
jgi:phage terminase large subunit-like protein